jgi:hypothetical protein
MPHALGPFSRSLALTNGGVCSASRCAAAPSRTALIGTPRGNRAPVAAAPASRERVEPVLPLDPRHPLLELLLQPGERRALLRLHVAPLAWIPLEVVELPLPAREIGDELVTGAGDRALRIVSSRRLTRSPALRAFHARGPADTPLRDHGLAPASPSRSSRSVGTRSDVADSRVEMVATHAAQRQPHQQRRPHLAVVNGCGSGFINPAPCSRERTRRGSPSHDHDRATRANRRERKASEEQADLLRPTLAISPS